MFFFIDFPDENGNLINYFLETFTYDDAISNKCNNIQSN